MPATDHLTTDQVAAFVAGRLVADARSDAEVHLSTCRACRQALVAQHAAVAESTAESTAEATRETVPEDLLARVRALVPSSSPVDPPGTGSDARSLPRRRAWSGALAAAAVLAVAVLGWTFMARGPDSLPGDSVPAESSPMGEDSVMRTTGDAAIVAPTLVSPAPDASFVVGDTFRWTPTPGATGYVLTVLDARGNVMATIETSATPPTRAVLPSGAGLTAGGQYYWYVDARLADSAEARSGIGRFVAAPDP